MYKAVFVLSAAIGVTGGYATLKINEARTEERRQQEEQEREQQLRKAEAEKLEQEREELERKKQELARQEQEPQPQRQEAERDKQFSAEFVKRNTSWLYEHDSNGKVLRDPRTGNFVLTPNGKRYVGYHREARAKGISNIEDATKYALGKLSADAVAARRIEAAKQLQHQEIVDFDDRFRRFVISRKNIAKSRRFDLDKEYGWVGKEGKPSEQVEVKSKYKALAAYEQETAKLDTLSLQLNAAIAAAKWKEAERLRAVAQDAWRNIR
jgi:hypothetical protein